MAFAIFYNREDLTPIAAELTRASLPPADKQFALAVWQAGANQWDTAPLAPDYYRCVMTPDGPRCDDDCRIVVIDGKHQGKTITLAQFREWIAKEGNLPGGVYLQAIADDMARTAVEPWPPVGGIPTFP